jgi:hypothetical protein
MPQTMATVVSEITTSLYTVASLHGGTFAISAEHESGLMNDPRIWVNNRFFSITQRASTFPDSGGVEIYEISYAARGVVII